MNKKNLVAAALLTAVMILAPGASSLSAAPAAQLIVALDPDYQTFDPALAYEAYAMMVLHPVYDTLMQFEKGIDELKYGVAESCKISDDGLVTSPPYQATGLPAGTLLLRVSAVSGANVISEPSNLTTLQYGALPQGGITNVSAFPNPFDSRTTAATIVYDLSSPSDMELQIFDAFGGKVRDMHFGAGGTGGRIGTNSVSWDGTDDGGRKVSMGLYVYVLRGGGAKSVHKLAVIH